MTTADTFAKDPKPAERFRLPDPPEDREDKMTNFNHLAANGNAHHSQDQGRVGSSCLSERGVGRRLPADCTLP